ncbi:MAG: hypothetical protein V9F06_13615 [Thermomicrobiales bacterium]
MERAGPGGPPAGIVIAWGQSLRAFVASGPATTSGSIVVWAAGGGRGGNHHES